MDNTSRLKAMKRLYYYRRRALRQGDKSAYNVIEREIEELRVRKQHDPQYVKRMKKNRIISQHKSYMKQVKSGYFKQRSRIYRQRHPERVKRACRNWYYSVKKDPKRYKQYLKNKRVENNKLRKHAKVTKNV